MVVVAIVGVLASLAAPSFSTMIKNNKLVTNINDLSTDIALARSESIKRGKRVTICMSTDGASCAASPATWASGRIVFVDLNADGAVDSGETILRITTALAGNTLTLMDGSATPVALDYIQYRPLGTTDSTGTFKLCDSRTGVFGRSVSINAMGRTTLNSSSVTCP